MNKQVRATTSAGAVQHGACPQQTRTPFSEDKHHAEWSQQWWSSWTCFTLTAHSSSMCCHPVWFGGVSEVCDETALVSLQVAGVRTHLQSESTALNSDASCSRHASSGSPLSLGRRHRSSLPSRHHCGDQVPLLPRISRSSHLLITTEKASRCL